MALWLVRAGRHGQDEEFALENGCVLVGWTDVPNLSKVKTIEEMRVLLENTYDYDSPRAIINEAAQLWAFLKRIKIGDLVVLPLKTRSVIAIGEITGEYQFKGKRHIREVKWLKDNIARSKFGQDLLYSFGAFMTVCQISRNNAEERVKKALVSGIDPQLKGIIVTKKEKISDMEIPEAVESFIDLEEQAFDQIRSVIESRFKGHDLARLVEAILNAQGYFTFRSPEGPDGGYDILAGQGQLGFDHPKLCVQVKSGGEQNDSAIRELEGVMSRVGAQHGLFVSWDGFNKAAIQKRKELFFKVRFWDDMQLMQALLENYVKLPASIQTELPLKRIWVRVGEEE